VEGFYRNQPILDLDGETLQEWGYDHDALVGFVGDSPTLYHVDHDHSYVQHLASWIQSPRIPDHVGPIDVEESVILTYLDT
jgi:hypothetical protein